MSILLCTSDFFKHKHFVENVTFVEKEVYPYPAIYSWILLIMLVISGKTRDKELVQSSW